MLLVLALGRSARHLKNSKSISPAPRDMLLTIYNGAFFETCWWRTVFIVPTKSLRISLILLVRGQQTLSGADPGEVKWVIFHSSFFWAPLLSFFSYPSNNYLKRLNQALVLLHCYKNLPPISKSWIHAWLFGYPSGTLEYNVKFSLYLNKAGLGNRETVQLKKKIILRCVGFFFYILHFWYEAN